MTDRQATSSDIEFRAPTGALAKAPLSSAVRVGGLILVSGQVGIDERGAVVSGGVAEQTRASLVSLQGILGTFGASLADVIQTRVFLTDFEAYDEYNRVYREFFSEPFPARSTVGTPELALGTAIEIEAIAYRPAHA